MQSASPTLYSLFVILELYLCARRCPLLASVQFEIYKNSITFYLMSPLCLFLLPFGRGVVIQITMHTAGSDCDGSAEINGISAQGHSGGAPHGACLIAAVRPL